MSIIMTFTLLVAGYLYIMNFPERCFQMQLSYFGALLLQLVSVFGAVLGLGLIIIPLN